MKKLRVGVIYGGRSGEHEVSLASAAAVFKNLDPSRYEPVAIRIEKDGRWALPDRPPRLISAAEVIEAAKAEAARDGLPPAETRLVVQGFGNVGSWAARIIADLGAKVIGVSDAFGAIHSEAGIDVHELRRHVDAGGRLTDFDGVDVIDADELIGLECDVLVPAALGGMIHAENAHLIKARAVIEGANSPTTPTADDIINDAGVLVVPDVLANAGGVVVSYYEWVQNLQHFRWDEREVNDKLGTTMRRAYREVATRAKHDDVPMRVAAFELGIELVLDAARTRGYI